MKSFEVSLTRVRSFSFLVMLLTYWGFGGGSLLAGGGHTESCPEICTLDVDCETACYVAYPDGPALDTDCGTFTDGQCGNTCDMVCNATSDGATECVLDGESSTCGAYGVYAHCWDNICVSGETCSNCSNDCFCPEPEQSYSFDYGDDAALCANRDLYGMSGQPCPTTLPTGLTCNEKSDGLYILMTKMRLQQAALQGQIARLQGCSGVECALINGEIAVATEKLTQTTNQYLALAASACYPSAYRRGR